MICREKILNGFESAKNIPGIVVFDTSAIIPPFFDVSNMKAYDDEMDDAVLEYMDFIKDIFGMGKAYITRAVQGELKNLLGKNRNIMTYDVINEITNDAAYNAKSGNANNENKNYVAGFEKIIHTLEDVGLFEPFPGFFSDFVISSPDLGGMWRYVLRLNVYRNPDKELWKDIKAFVDGIDLRDDISETDKGIVKSAFYIRALFNKMISVSIVTHDHDIMSIIKASKQYNESCDYCDIPVYRFVMNDEQKVKKLKKELCVP